jgi:C4-dicarboxylate transporter
MGKPLYPNSYKNLNVIPTIEQVTQSHAKYLKEILSGIYNIMLLCLCQCFVLELLTGFPVCEAFTIT